MFHLWLRLYYNEPGLLKLLVSTGALKLVSKSQSFNLMSVFTSAFKVSKNETLLY